MSNIVGVISFVTKKLYCTLRSSVPNILLIETPSHFPIDFESCLRCRWHRNATLYIQFSTCKLIFTMNKWTIPVAGTLVRKLIVSIGISTINCTPPFHTFLINDHTVRVGVLQFPAISSSFVRRIRIFSYWEIWRMNHRRVLLSVWFQFVVY